MKKVFLTASLLALLILCSFSVSALEASMTDTYLISNTNGYTFETVITPTVTAECMPVIAMYDSDDLLCGLMYGETISVTSGSPVVKTFTVTPGSSPASIKLMLWKADGSFAPLCSFEQVSTSLYSEKYGMIVEAAADTGVKLFTSDATSAVTYSFADSFVLSCGNTVISNSTSAYDYLNSLRLFSYKRFAESGTKPAYYDWIISFGDGDISSSTDIRYKSTTATNAYLYNYSDFLSNYAARMVRVLVSGDKIGSMAFADDSLFGKLTSGKSYEEAFYTSSSKSFNDSLSLTDNDKILYFPARADAAESQFKVYTPDTLKNGNLYYLKNFTDASGKQIVLVTHMFTDSELTSFNTKPITNISVALNGDSSNTSIKGINNYLFNISLSDQSDDNNDLANEAANLAMEYVAEGLQGALDGADSGYAITRNYIKIKFKSEIAAAREQINILSEMDTRLGAAYYNELKNEIPNAIGNSATAFLEDYFLSD